MDFDPATTEKLQEYLAKEEEKKKAKEEAAAQKVKALEVKPSLRTLSRMEQQQALSKKSFLGKVYYKYFTAVVAIFRLRNFTYDDQRELVEHFSQVFVFIFEWVLFVPFLTYRVESLRFFYVHCGILSFHFIFLLAAILSGWAKIHVLVFSVIWGATIGLVQNSFKGGVLILPLLALFTPVTTRFIIKGSGIVNHFVIFSMATFSFVTTLVLQLVFTDIDDVVNDLNSMTIYGVIALNCAILLVSYLMTIYVVVESRVKQFREMGKLQDVLTAVSQLDLDSEVCWKLCSQTPKTLSGRERVLRKLIKQVRKYRRYLPHALVRRVKISKQDSTVSSTGEKSFRHAVSGFATSFRESIASNFSTPAGSPMSSGSSMDKLARLVSGGGGSGGGSSQELANGQGTSNKVHPAPGEGGPPGVKEKRFSSSEIMVFPSISTEFVEKDVTIVFIRLKNLLKPTNCNELKKYIEELSFLFDDVNLKSSERKGNIHRFSSSFIVVIFNGATNNFNHVENACRFALEIEETYENEGFESLDLNIFISTSECFIGEIGGKAIRGFDVISKNNRGIEFTKKMSKYTEKYKVVISDSTNKSAQYRVVSRAIDMVEFRNGLSRKKEILYAIKGRSENTTKEVNEEWNYELTNFIEEKDIFKDIWKHIEKRELDLALEVVKDFLDKEKDNKFEIHIANVLHERIEMAVTKGEFQILRL